MNLSKDNLLIFLPEIYILDQVSTCSVSMTRTLSQHSYLRHTQVSSIQFDIHPHTLLFPCHMFQQSSSYHCIASGNQIRSTHLYKLLIGIQNYIFSKICTFFYETQHTPFICTKLHVSLKDFFVYRNGFSQYIFKQKATYKRVLYVNI